MLSTAASNALLKTLEEPPAHVVFVLATTDPQKVLPTIRSRTQHFEFHAAARPTSSPSTSRVHHRATPGSRPTPRPSTSSSAEAGAARPATPSRCSTRSPPSVAAPSKVDPAVDDRRARWRARDARAPRWSPWPRGGRRPRPPPAGRGVASPMLRVVFLALLAPELESTPDDERRSESRRRRLGPPAYVRAMEVSAARASTSCGRPRRTRRPRGRARPAVPPEADVAAGALLERIERLGARPGSATPHRQGRPPATRGRPRGEVRRLPGPRRAPRRRPAPPPRRSGNRPSQRQAKRPRRRRPADRDDAHDGVGRRCSTALAGRAARFTAAAGSSAPTPTSGVRRNADPPPVLRGGPPRGARTRWRPHFGRPRAADARLPTGSAPTPADTGARPTHESKTCAATDAGDVSATLETLGPADASPAARLTQAFPGARRGRRMTDRTHRTCRRRT